MLTIIHLITWSYMCFVVAALAPPLVKDLLVAPANSSMSGGNTSAKVATAWYAGWHGTDFPPSNVSWNKYRSLIYAFACVFLRASLGIRSAESCHSTTTTNVSEISLEDSDQALLPVFVQAAHDNVRSLHSSIALL